MDISALGLDQTLFVRDLKLGDKYTVLTRGEVPVAVVKAPDDAVPGAAAATGEAAAPAVIKKGKEEAAAGDAKAGDAKKEEKK